MLVLRECEDGSLYILLDVAVDEVHIHIEGNYSLTENDNVPFKEGGLNIRIE